MTGGFCWRNSEASAAAASPLPTPFPGFVWGGGRHIDARYYQYLSNLVLLSTQLSVLPSPRSPPSKPASKDGGQVVTVVVGRSQYY